MIRIPDLEGVESGSLPAVLEALRRLDREDWTEAGEPLRVHLLRNFTIETLPPFVRFHLYAAGIPSAVEMGGHGTIAQDLLALGTGPARPDILVFALEIEGLVPDPEVSTWDPEAVFARIQELFETARSRAAGAVVVHTLPRPLHLEGRLSGRARPDSLAWRVGRLNRAIEDHVAEAGAPFALVDWERILMRLGERAAIDRRFGYLSRAPFKPAFLDAYAREIAAIGRSLRGHFKKCLVLDCDNTLWGGIAGEAGISGIVLDRHEFPGKAYHDFQKSVLALRESGVLLALCSRNDPETVWEILERHPACLLRREHLAAARINWDSKVENLVELSRELNLGLDSFVFVDDSEAECHLVRVALPEVAVRQVPSRLHRYAELLFDSGDFDRLGATGEDRRRTEMYQAEARRRELAGELADVGSYLASLEMRATVHRMREGDLARVAQLTQKTNQFNLTTRRYAESRILEMASDPSWRIFTLSPRDRFGDSGLTGVLIARRELDTVHVDTLLLSCRILGRRLDEAFVGACLARLAEEWGPFQWRAEYLPTAKNAQVSEFWPRFGFLVLSRTAEGTLYRAGAGEIRLEPVGFIETVFEEP